MVLLLTATALCCFAANSLLCRLALADHQIDAASFTAIRLVSGALVLWLVARQRKGAGTAPSASWASAGLLFAYAAPFSYAYLRLGASMGALILFGSVQVTMLGWGIWKGERPTPTAWLGIALALAGLVGLTLRGQGAPDALGLLEMVVAGIAWGAYSLRGRSASGDPVRLTASSFARSLPLVALLLAVAIPGAGAHASVRGVLLAMASGGLASGLGYSIWYSALPHLSALRAAAVQLLVPLLAAGAAVAWLDESVSLRLVLTSAAILGGVTLTLRVRVAPRA